MISNYRELTVWNKAMDLTTLIYKIVEKFPREEMYGLISQMKRSAISIPSNIAEGNKRGTRADYRHFLIIAMGSGAELETQIEIAKRLNFISNTDIAIVNDVLEQVMKMLNVMITKLQPTT